MPSITISGIVSGLDTTSIIDKLVAVEGNRRSLLSNQQTTQRSAVTAYSSLVTGVKALSTQVAALADASTWSTTTATSSSSSVTATATGKASASLSFDVTKLAAAHTVISNETVSDPDTVVASSGSVKVTDSEGLETDLDVGSGSLAEVVAAINGSDTGLRATQVQTAPGQFRLQVASRTTGDASTFTLDGLDGFTAMNELTTGSDAQITVGSGAFAYTVSSATNTFAGVTDGLSFTVSKLETGVTVTADVDPTSVTDQINAIVTGANNLLASIASSTAWDSTTRTGGPLVGSSVARSLQQGIVSVVAGAGAPGLSVTATGQLSFDADAFKAAFADDPTQVINAFGSRSSFVANGSSTATVVNSTSTTRAGDYEVQVNTAATAEQWTLVPPGTGIVGRLMSLTRGDTTVDYEPLIGDDLTSAAAAFNAKLATAGMQVEVGVSGGNFVFTSTVVGSAGAFDVDIDGGVADQTVIGADADAEIDGLPTTARGNLISLASDADSGAAGLTIDVTTTDTDINSTGGLIGTVGYSPGVARQLQALFEQMTDTVDGPLTQAQDAAGEQVKNLQKQIESWTTRLDAYRATLTQQFTAMESALSSLKSQSSALSSFFSSGSSSSSSSS